MTFIVVPIPTEAFSAFKCVHCPREATTRDKLGRSVCANLVCLSRRIVETERVSLPDVPSGCMRCFVWGIQACVEHRKQQLEEQERQDAARLLVKKKAVTYPEPECPPLPGWDVVGSVVVLAEVEGRTIASRTEWRYVRPDGCVVFPEFWHGAWWWKLYHPVCGLLADHAAGTPDVLMGWADKKIPWSHD